MRVHKLIRGGKKKDEAKKNNKKGNNKQNHLFQGKRENKKNR